MYALAVAAKLEIDYHISGDWSVLKTGLPPLVNYAALFPANSACDRRFPVRLIADVAFTLQQQCDPCSRGRAHRNGDISSADHQGPERDSYRVSTLCMCLQFDEQDCTSLRKP